MKRLNILIVAHELSPKQGSECAVGWNIVTNLSKYHNLTVIYAKTNQFQTSDYESSVKEYFTNKEEFLGLKLVPVPQPKTTIFFVKINSLIKSETSAIGFAPLYYTGYKAWQKKAFQTASILLKESKFDIVHQLTSISFREPGYLWQLNVPFVWGPCSGLVKIPTSFYGILTLKEIGFELLRKTANFFQSNFSYRINRAINKASIIYPVTIDDLIYFKSRTKFDVRQMLDVGTYLRLNNNISIKNNDNSPLKLLWIGRLVYTKALDLLLYALNLDTRLNEKIELTIIGDGPLFNRYQDLSVKLNLVNITWLGNISHNQVFSQLQNSDVLVQTSIKEATSAVILEALTFGLPVICHDAFGMSYAINETCGIKIPLITPNKSIEGFSKAILKLTSQPEELARLKKGAINRAKELSWNSMAMTIANDYLTIHKNHENTINK